MNHIQNLEELLIIISILVVIGLAIFGGLISRSVKAYISYRHITIDIDKISTALLNSLVHAKK